jgi:hypothetical protein
MIRRRDVAEKLIDYLYHRITLEELVDWAEDAMREDGFEAEQFDLLRNIVSHLGVADVEAFGLTWETIESYLEQLGYRVQLEVSQAH